MRALHPQGTCVICGNAPPMAAIVPASALNEPNMARYDPSMHTAIRAERARRSLYQFLIQGWHVLEPTIKLEQSWHIETLCNHVQWMFEQWLGYVPRETQNLICNVPPGTLKSRIFSVYGPAWAWLHRQEMSFLCLSSTPGVALRDADMNKELISSSWYRETFKIDWEVRTDADAKGLFKTTARGVRQSQGLNAKVTGIRADCIIFDDPNDIKDTSEVKLKAVKNSWLAARNRLNDLRIGVRLGVQQRTNEQDLTGHLLEQGGWDHLCIPMEYTETKCPCGAEKCDTKLGKNDPRTIPGEVLQPERNTPAVLAEERKSMGSLAYAGQMNQRPAPEGGAIFQTKDWRYYDELPHDKGMRFFVGPGTMSCDLTFGDTGTSRCAFLVMFPRNDARRYVDFAWAGKLDYPKMKAKLMEIYQLYLNNGSPGIGKILVEGKANGDALISELGSTIPGIVRINPTQDKITRAKVCVPTVEAGNILLRKDSPWIDEFKGELASFPTGTYDDLVDVFSQAISHLAPTGAARRLENLCKL